MPNFTNYFTFSICQYEILINISLQIFITKMPHCLSIYNYLHITYSYDRLVNGQTQSNSIDPIQSILILTHWVGYYSQFFRIQLIIRLS